MVKAPPEGFSQPKSTGTITLWIGINYEDLHFGHGQTGAEVDCGRGFTDSTLLIRDSDYLAHSLPITRSSVLSCEARTMLNFRPSHVPKDAVSRET